MKHLILNLSLLLNLLRILSLNFGINKLLSQSTLNILSYLILSYIECGAVEVDKVPRGEAGECAGDEGPCRGRN